MIRDLIDGRPRVDPTAWIADNAVVVGDVTIGASSSVWYSATVRADQGPIAIGSESNVQDAAVLHSGATGLSIGDRVNIGHGAILHGCTVEAGAMVGMRALVMDGALVEEGAIVAAGALVAPGVIVKRATVVVGQPAEVTRLTTFQDRERLADGSRLYMELSRRHRDAGWHASLRCPSAG